MIQRVAIEHTYTRTDTYYATYDPDAGETIEDVVALFKEGELECEAKEDGFPETIEVNPAREDGGVIYGLKPLYREHRES